MASILNECENYFSQGGRGKTEDGLKSEKPLTQLSATSETPEKQASEFERLLFSDAVNSYVGRHCSALGDLEKDCAALSAKLHTYSFPDPTMFQPELSA